MLHATGAAAVIIAAAAVFAGVVRGFDGGLDLVLGALVVLVPCFLGGTEPDSPSVSRRRGFDGARALHRCGGWFCPVVCAEAEQLAGNGLAGQYFGIVDPAYRVGVAATTE